ncbi:hypothetical protein [Deinococcus hopiensis]|uniref:hypothetical protein n=1 Tax=Deinococcus hopiensis TaxID=309885 RepID=UPI001FE499AF|nr:hypothetical protein [Deinococcus hopiensis]
MQLQTGDFYDKSVYCVVTWRFISADSSNNVASLDGTKAGHPTGGTHRRGNFKGLGLSPTALRWTSRWDVSSRSTDVN